MSAAPHRRRIAAVEPYFGGSHRHFLEDLRRHSRHELQLFTLPPRLWKWRVRGSALHLAPELNAACEDGSSFDVLLCSDFVNVPDLRALLLPRLRSVPVLYYLHENQLSYPLSPDEVFDPYFGFTNVLSCLSAEAVAFNSEFHRREFLEHLPGILPRLPDYDRRWVQESIAAKTEVLPVGLDVAALEATPREPALPGAPPRILWNHRWEFDKQPEKLFAALEALASEGVAFAADVAGESFARRPGVFDAARQRLGDRIGAWGYVASRAEYVDLLRRADIVVSTAKQEFFGIAMAEAVLVGAFPVAPDGLVYRDLYAGPCAAQHLYAGDDDLLRLLQQALAVSGSGASRAREHMRECGIPSRLRAFDWHDVAPRFDARFEALAARDHPAPAPD